MTTTADDAALEAAFEAYLAGRPVPEGAAGLIAFVAAARATATRPTQPSAALAELLSTGLPTDPSPARVARPAGKAARDRSRSRRRLVPALFAKFAAAGAIARAATGAAVVAVGLSTAGFSGVLPASAQHTFATVVEAVTPFRAPDPTRTAEPSGPASPSDTAVPAAGGDPATDVPEGTVPAHPSNFGGEVSRQAHENGGGDGRGVSSQAHERNDERRAQRSAGSTPATRAAEPGDDRGGGSSATGDGSGSGRGGDGSGDKGAGGGGSGGHGGGHR